MDLSTAKKRLYLRFRSAQKEFDRIVNSDSFDEGDLHIALGTIEEEIKKNSGTQRNNRSPFSGR